MFRDPANFDRYAADCAALAEFDISTQIIDGQDYLRSEPALKPGVVGAIHFPGDARLRPDRYVAALARAVRDRVGCLFSTPRRV